MTSREFLGLAARRWYVVLVGLAVCGAVVGVLHSIQSQVYWAKATYVVLTPTTAGTDNPLELQTDATGVAGLLVRSHNGSASPALPASPEATLYGQGIRSGSRVTLRDVGGQWASAYAGPQIDIEVVGTSPDDVTSSMDSISDDIEADLAAWQDKYGVAPEDRYSLQRAPGGVGIVMVGGRPSRMMLSIVLLGLLFTALLVWVVDALLTSRDAARSLSTGLPGGRSLRPDS